ncbi:MAG: hypothetical protein AB7F86_01370 [Bdellovibrionales bacterium]
MKIKALFNSKAIIPVSLIGYLIIATILAYSNSGTMEELKSNFGHYLHAGLNELSIWLFILSLSWILDAKQEIVRFGRKSKWFKISQLVGQIIHKDATFGSDSIYELYTELVSINPNATVNPGTNHNSTNMNIANIQEHLVQYLSNVLFHASFSKNYRSKKVSSEGDFWTMLHLLRAKVQSEVIEGSGGDAH